MTDDARKRILAANQAAAEALRRRFAASGTLVVNLISSPGSGKTTLLQHTAERLSGRVRMAAVVGDIATERDADRLREAGMPAHQIVTGGACHLDARMVEQAMQVAGFGDELDLLLIENVGNLVCPASYDLGEDFKVVLLSVTEGHDKPFKYPGIFSKAGISLVTKWDLLPHVPFDYVQAREQILSLNPSAVVLPVSVSTEEGLDEWCTSLTQRIESRRAASSVS